MTGDGVSRRWSRRGLLAGVGLSVLGARTATAAAQMTSTTATNPIPTDAMLIAGLLQVEGQVADVYARAIASGALTGAGLSLAREVLSHERAHTVALRRELRALGGSELPLPGTAKALEGALATHHVTVNLGAARTGRHWLKLLADVEDVLERNYHLAISELRRPALMTLCAEILGSEAQHSALLGEMLSPRNVQKALPNAFINGD
jgi:hypothetical protein